MKSISSALGLAVLFFLFGWLFLTPARTHRVSIVNFERDLKLELQLFPDSPDSLYASIGRRVTLTNRSQNHILRTVRLGLGAEKFHGIPNLKWDVWRKDLNGQWIQHEVTQRRRMFCGTCLASDMRNWHDRIEVLKPNDQLIFYPELFVIFDRSGDYRVQAHYEIPKSELLEVHAVTPFRISSNICEIAVHRPLDIQLKVLKPIKLYDVSRISEIFQLTMTNRSNHSISCQPSVSLEVSDEIYGGYRGFDQHASFVGDMNLIAPGETVGLISKLNQYSKGRDGIWRPYLAGKGRVRALIWENQDSHNAIYSEWVDVTVVP